MRPHYLKYNKYRKNKACIKIQTKVRMIIQNKTFQKIKFISLFISSRYHGKKGRIQVKLLKRELKSNVNLQQQVSTYQESTLLAQKKSAALELETKEALLKLESAEREGLSLSSVICVSLFVHMYVCVFVHMCFHFCFVFFCSY